MTFTPQTIRQDDSCWQIDNSSFLLSCWPHLMTIRFYKCCRKSYLRNLKQDVQMRLLNHEYFNKIEIAKIDPVTFASLAKQIGLHEIA